MRRLPTIIAVLALLLVATPAAQGQSVSRPGSDPATRGMTDRDAADVGESRAPETGSDRDEQSEFADQTFVDDLIVQGSACIGLDCMVNQSFGFATIDIAENNTRIRFTDTSNSGAFPTNDWQIVANDSVNGGRSYLGFEDLTAGRMPFRVMAGGPENGFVLDAFGRVGMGTLTPGNEIHIVDGDTPGIRFEQVDRGFGTAMWDVSANETNFFIRQVDNGQALPFRIRPGAPTSAIDVAADGKVGLGTDTPTANLDVTGTGGISLALTSKDGDDWALSTATTGQPLAGLSVTGAGAGSPQLRVTPDGGVAMATSVTAPANPVAGMMAFDGNTFCGYDGAQWLPLQAGGDATCF